MSAKLALALSLALAFGCSSTADPLVTAAETQADQAAAAKGEPPLSSSCRAESGIWTMRLAPMTATTAVNCASASTVSTELGLGGTTRWNFASPGTMSGCEGGGTIDPDGCSMICDSTVTGGAQEMQLNIESATQMSGSLVVTLTGGTRCEYDVTATKG